MGESVPDSREASCAEGGLSFLSEEQWPAGTISVGIEYREPYRFDELLAFFRVRALAGVEAVDERSYARTVRFAKADGATVVGWVRVEEDSDNARLLVTMSEALAPFVAEVVGRIRRMFDADCDPSAVAEGLAPAIEAVLDLAAEGTRLPGCFEPFETACRAVLGQQVSVAAACKLAGCIVEAYGEPVETGIEGLTHAWPAPERFLALNPIEDALGELGVIKTRSRVIAEIAAGLSSGALDFGPEADAEEQIERLVAIKGIGPWTANYIAMRALGYTDAFLETDAGVAHALPDLAPKERVAFAEPCRPWRSYLVVSLWNMLG